MKTDEGDYHATRSRSSHVSQLSHATARRKIEVKIALLEFWGRESVPWKRDADGKFLFDQNGEKILEYVPSSENEVRRWKAGDNSPGIITTALEKLFELQFIEQDHLHAFNSYDAAALTPGGIQKIRNSDEKTRYIALKQNLNRALEVIKATQKRQIESENKGSLVSELQQRIRVMNLQRESAAQQSIVDRKELRDSIMKWKKQEGKYERREKEFKEIIAVKDEKIAALEAKIAGLIKERQHVLGMQNANGASRET